MLWDSTGPFWNYCDFTPYSIIPFHKNKISSSLREGYRVTICRPRCRRVIIEEDERQEKEEENDNLKKWITQKLSGIESQKKIPKTLIKNSSEKIIKGKLTVVDGGVLAPDKQTKIIENETNNIMVRIEIRK